MENLKYRLTCAQSLIEDVISSYQKEPKFAAQYALEQLDLPDEAEEVLFEYAKECELQLARIIKNN